MRALVTGGAGLIGSHIVDRLLARGFDVRIVDSLEKPCHMKGMPPWVPPEAEFIKGDVIDRAVMARALQGVDVVFHQAAHQGLLPDFSRFFAVNAAGTSLIYELIVENRLPVRKVIFASSQGVYGEGAYRCPEHGLIFPEPRPLSQLERGQWEHACPHCGAPLCPEPTDEERVASGNIYAQSKLAAERAALHLGRLYDVPTVVLRYCITQGPRQSLTNAYSGVCSIFAMRLINAEPPIVYEDGLQTRDYAYVGDVADANLFVMDCPRVDYGVFNVGTGCATTVLEFLEGLGRALGRPVEPLIAGVFRLGDVRHFRPDVSRLAALGWRATTPLEETLRRYVHWLEEQGSVVDYFAEAEASMRKRGVVRSVLAPKAALPLAQAPAPARR
jgi:dTDP-L-rhamnose 4-epimerase